MSTKNNNWFQEVTIDGMRHVQMTSWNGDTVHAHCTICEWSKYAKTQRTVGASFRKAHGLA